MVRIMATHKLSLIERAAAVNNELVCCCGEDLVQGEGIYYNEVKLKLKSRRRRSQSLTNMSCIFRGFIVTTLLLVLLLSLPSSHAFLNPIDVITRDFQALTRKVTAYHILLPKSTDVALSLKQSIRDKTSPKSSDDPKFIVDVFCTAAQKYSRDEETAIRGGLLGEKAPQGYCRSRELDAACFKAPLGEISGPIESDFGYHLLLVTERTNCPKLDGKYNKIIRDEDGVSTKFVCTEEGSDQMIKTVAMQQIGFWIGVSFAGGVMAEVAAKAANVVETLPWE